MIQFDEHILRWVETTNKITIGLDIDLNPPSAFHAARESPRVSEPRVCWCERWFLDGLSWICFVGDFFWRLWIPWDEHHHENEKHHSRENMFCCHFFLQHQTSKCKVEMVEMVKSKMRCSSSIVHHFVAREKKVEKDMEDKWERQICQMGPECFYWHFTIENLKDNPQHSLSVRDMRFCPWCCCFFLTNCSAHKMWSKNSGLGRCMAILTWTFGRDLKKFALILKRCDFPKDGCFMEESEAFFFEVGCKVGFKRCYQIYPPWKHQKSTCK